MIQTTTPEVLAHFDRLCAAVQAKGQGMSHGQIGDAHALAREMEKPEPDPERVDSFRGRLGIDPEEARP